MMGLIKWTNDVFRSWIVLATLDQVSLHPRLGDLVSGVVWHVVCCHRAQSFDIVDYLYGFVG